MFFIKNLGINEVFYLIIVSIILNDLITALLLVLE